MVKLYGPNNGFGWKMNEIIGRADRLGADGPADPQRNMPSSPHELVTVVFAVLFRDPERDCSRFLIVEPITRLSHAAEQISKGPLDRRRNPRDRRDVGVAARTGVPTHAPQPGERSTLSTRIARDGSPQRPARGHALHGVPHQKCSALAVSASRISRWTRTWHLRVAVKNTCRPTSPCARQTARSRRARRRPWRSSTGASAAFSTSRAPSPRSATRTSCA